MYQQSQFDPALLSLMSVAKKVTPQGQPTVAAGIMQQAGVPPQAMQPGSPQGMMPPPPQGMPPPQQGLPGVLQQTQQAAPSVAQNMQEQQTAQMLAQAQPQPPMMAEGGIASLPVDDYEYADGGIIGYAAGGEFDLGDSEEARLRDEERVRIIKERQREEHKRLTAEMLGRPYELPQQVAAPKTIAPARFETDSTDPVRRINQLATILKNDQTLDPENRARLAQEINQLYAQINAAPQGRQPSAAPPEVGIPSALPPQRAPSDLSNLFSKSEAAIKEMRTPEEKTPQQIAQKRMEYLRSMGLPTDAGAAEEARLKELEAFDAETRAGIPGRQKAQMQNALLQGILNPPRKAMHLGELLAGTGSALGNEEEKIARESEASRGKQREQMIAMATARRALDMARRQEAMGDYAGAEASRETANAAFNKMQEAKIGLFGKQAELTAAGERASEMPANMQELMFAIKNPEEYAKAVRAKAGPVAGERQDLAELAKLQTNLTSQLENISLPAPRRAELQGMLDQVTARLATMSGLEPAPANRIRFDAQGNQIK
jgi:hypothetical protein